MARTTVPKATAETSAPKDVTEKWEADGVALGDQIRRASSSFSWYRAALKKKGLKAATRETYKAQAARYEGLLVELRAARDESKASS